MLNPAEINLDSLPYVPLERKADLPSVPSIYFAIDSQGEVQYIGRSIDLKRRWINHHRYPELVQMSDVRIAYLDCPLDLLPEVEAALVGWFQPILNNASVSIPRKKLKKQQDYKTSFDLFNQIRRVDEGNCEFWLAKELMTVCGYARWTDFKMVISRAKQACSSMDIPTSDHFVSVPGSHFQYNEFSDPAKIAFLSLDKQELDECHLQSNKNGRPSMDCKLSRYAAYLVVMNGDIGKSQIAALQCCFALKLQQLDLL